MNLGGVAEDTDAEKANGQTNKKKTLDEEQNSTILSQIKIIGSSKGERWHKFEY